MTCMEASRRFNIFLEDKITTLLPPDIRKATYTAVMQRVRTTNRYVFESLIKLYRETDIGQEKAQLLTAMASCPDPNIVLEMLNFFLSSEVRDQDVIYALAGISSEGSETAWSWLKANWEHISDRWGRHILLTHFIRDIVSQFFSDEKADEIKEFFLSHTEPSIARTVKQSIEHVRINAKWRSYIESEQNLEELIMKLAQKTGGTSE